MAINKFANSEVSTGENIFASISDPAIEARFKKFAKDLKAVAPKANDFLYFTAIMMHSAEASLLDMNGELRKDAHGNHLESSFEQVVDKQGEKSVRWVCSDKNIHAYKNSNGDIFPESELVAAHEKWRGRPLCIDHKSSSVDHVRGLVVDTYYDKKRKRVIALCALDKKNYPDLASKVSSGVSANVSMGTAVGRAICTENGCHRVARIESDFCEHMLSKSGYGEINMDLSPIELSIVVTGADPDAKIKHIIAKDLSKAAEEMSSYVDVKEASSPALVTLLEELQAVTSKLSKLADDEDSKEDDNAAAHGQTGSGVTMAEADLDGVQAHNLPETVPSVTANIQDLKVKIAGFQKNLQQLEFINEENMTKKKVEAYYQGTEEPTPGTPKYEVDPGDAKARLENKDMVGQSPFPGTGPIDGMHPGTASSGVSEEARKRELQRLASIEQRRLKREAAFSKVKSDLEEKKVAYFQGTEEPTAGKAQYPADPGNEKSRMEDKHMVGQKPFPGVGGPDGMHDGPDSADTKPELKRKQMLQRADAKLGANFVRVANTDGSINYGDSHWQILAKSESGDKVILTASVDELTGGDSDSYYTKIATKDFAQRMMRTIRAEGFSKAKALFKGAEGGKPTMGAPADAAPAAVAPAGPVAAPEMPEMAPELEDPGVDAPDPLALVGEVMDRLSDLEEALKAAEGEAGSMDEVEPMAEADLAMADDGLQSVASLQGMRKTLNGMLTTAMAETIETLKAHAEELKLAHSVVAGAGTLGDSQKTYLNSLVADASAHAKQTLADSSRLVSAYIKYASGTQSLLKRASLEGGLKKTAQEVIEFDIKETEPIIGGTTPATPTLEGALDQAHADDGKKDDDKDEKKDKKDEDDKEDKDDKDEKKDKKEDKDDDDKNNVNYVVSNAGEASQLNAGDDDTVSIKSAEINLQTKEGRAMARAKLAQKGLSFSDMLGKAHPKGSAEVANLDTKPSGDLGTVEDLVSTHTKMMQLAELPPKVRKQAEQIAALVTEGKIASEDVDKLVSHGVDAEAVKYYKAYWGEAKDSDSKEFAAKLVSEHATKKAAAAKVASETRLARAYDLAYQMRDNGHIESGQIKGQVDEILKWNDESFNSFQKLVVSSAKTATASIPEVGFMASGDLMLPAKEASVEPSMTELFSGLFDGKKL